MLVLLGVSGSKQMLALMILAFWLPATSHALLENAHLIHEQEAASHSDRDHDAADGVCLLRSDYLELHSIGDGNALFGSTAALQLLHFNNSFARPSPEFIRSGPSPPLLQASWQFAFRTALPARAPSSTI